jgi:hypothetical protein
VPQSLSLLFLQKKENETKIKLIDLKERARFPKKNDEKKLRERETNLYIGIK